MLRVTHLTSSRFFGGPERQMLELARELASHVEMSFLSFSEEGLCHEFLGRVHEAGFHAEELTFDTPHLLAAARQLKRLLIDLRIDILLCHGYKADLLGYWAANAISIPVIAVSRGWTGESRRVRFYEQVDRRVLQFMTKVVCVSHGQADKVGHAGVNDENIIVIHDSVRTDRFADSNTSTYRDRLLSMFPRRPQYVVGAAGRLSPEKGFDLLIDAAARLLGTSLSLGFVVFGDGPLRDSLSSQIRARGLESHFLLAGFSHELDRYMPHFDLFVQSSHTEGLPNVLLEAGAAGVALIATDVGGTSEIVSDSQYGRLVSPADPRRLAKAIFDGFSDPLRMSETACAGRERIAEHFTFERQANEYRSLFGHLASELQK